MQGCLGPLPVCRGLAGPPSRSSTPCLGMFSKWLEMGFGDDPGLEREPAGVGAKAVKCDVSSTIQLLGGKLLLDHVAVDASALDELKNSREPVISSQTEIGTGSG